MQPEQEAGHEAQGAVEVEQRGVDRVACQEPKRRPTHGRLDPVHVWCDWTHGQGADSSRSFAAMGEESTHRGHEVRTASGSIRAAGRELPSHMRTYTMLSAA